VTILRGRYLLDSEIGSGATGVVWRARDVRLGRQVALKLLRADCITDPDACARFEREARTIAQLRSPHIVQIFDYGIEGDQPYIVMELLDGEDLESRLKRYPKMPIALVADLVTNVSRALAAIHRAGIAHRDLKPANVFLSREGRGEIPKLLDFSVAASLPRPLSSGDADLELTNSLAGTPLYMSPEHFWGGVLEPASDLWSLAVICYQLLTGTHPFVGTSLGQLQARICNEPHVLPSKVVDGLPSGVDPFFARALAKDPAARFTDAGSFADAMAALINVEQAEVVRVLYLDDEADMELLVRKKFRRQVNDGRYELYFARNGEEGLAELSRRPDIDVVLTDINMPEMDGLAFLARVPEINPIVPVVVVSAYSDMANLRTAMNRGAFDFLCKPIDFEDLERTIEKTAAHSRILRSSLRSREDNERLKLFVGLNGDAAIRVIREDQLVSPETYEATVVFARLARDSVEGENLRRTFHELNHQLNLVVPEFRASDGHVAGFGDHTVLVVYRGEDHEARAVDACVAAQARLRDERSSCCLAFGIDAGTLVAGTLGNAALGRMEHVVLGDPVECATQLQALADPAQIVVTARLAERLSETHTFTEHVARLPAARTRDQKPVRVLGRREEHSGILVAVLADTVMNAPNRAS
jgi:eukaryotic-like serine/threonine-protein kinase